MTLLIIKCDNPECNQEFHLANLQSPLLNLVMATMPLPVSVKEAAVVRLPNEVNEILETFPDSDSLEAYIEKVGVFHYSETTPNKQYNYLKDIPEATMEDLRYLSTDASAQEKSEEVEHSLFGEDEDENINADELFKLIPYTPNPELTTMEQSKARHIHYQSEIARLQALSIIHNIQ